MSPILLIGTLCLCCWIGYWGYDEIEGDYAPVGLLAILLAICLALASVALHVRSLP
jgi:hypothetical protein